MKWQSLPPLSALRAFSAYAQTGSVQKAGTALNVSHAAISQQIRNLEAHLGLTLLDRSGRQASLTPQARRLAQTLAESFHAIAQQIDSLTGAENERPLKIATTPSFAAQWLVPRLASFTEAYPGIDVIFDASPALVDLIRNEADVAIRFGKGSWPGLDAHPVLYTRMIAVAAPSLVTDRAPVSPNDLAHFPVLQEVGTSESTRWLERHGVIGAGGGGRLALPGTLTLDAARAGQGIAITNDVWVQSDLATGRLVKLFEDTEIACYFALTRPGVLRPSLRNFMKWLRTQTAHSQES